MRALLAVALLVAVPVLAADPAPAAARKVQVKVTDAGFEPREVKLKKGEPVTLVFLRTTDRTCIRAIDIPDEKVKNLVLPLDKPTPVTITPKKAGVEVFHCTSMGMGGGKLVVAE